MYLAYHQGLSGYQRHDEKHNKKLNLIAKKVQRNTYRYQNEFKQWWKREYNTRCPKGQELVNYLNIKLGPYKRRGWWGYEIIYDEYDSD